MFSQQGSYASIIMDATPMEYINEELGRRVISSNFSYSTGCGNKSDAPNQCPNRQSKSRMAWLSGGKLACVEARPSASSGNITHGNYLSLDRLPSQQLLSRWRVMSVHSLPPAFCFVPLLRKCAILFEGTLAAVP